MTANPAPAAGLPCLDCGALAGRFVRGPGDDDVHPIGEPDDDGDWVDDDADEDEDDDDEEPLQAAGRDPAAALQHGWCFSAIIKNLRRLVEVATG